MYKFSDKINSFSLKTILPGAIRNLKYIGIIPIFLFILLFTMDSVNKMTNKKSNLTKEILGLTHVWLPICFFYLISLILESIKVYQASHFFFDITLNEIKIFDSKNIVKKRIPKELVLEVLETSDLLVVYYKKKSHSILFSTERLGPYSKDYLNKLKTIFNESNYEIVSKRLKSLNL